MKPAEVKRGRAPVADKAKNINCYMSDADIQVFETKRKAAIAAKIILQHINTHYSVFDVDRLIKNKSVKLDIL